MAAAAPQPAWLYTAPAADTPELGIIDDSMSYGERLFHYTYATRHDDVHFLEYRMLHRLNIFNLQNRLAKFKGSCWTRHDVQETELLDLKDMLHDYSKYLKVNVVARE